MNTKLLLISLIFRSTETLSQSMYINQQDREYCAKSRQLSYMHPGDSTRHQVVLDSVNRLLVGRWQLVDIGTKTFKVMPTPQDSIEMSVDGQGNSIVYVRRKQIVNFQLAASISYNYLRCVISEVGRSYFKLETPTVSDGRGGISKGQPVYRNGLRVCEGYLELYAFTSAGPIYIFKRLAPIQLENEQRN